MRDQRRLFAMSDADEGHFASKVRMQLPQRLLHHPPPALVRSFPPRAHKDSHDADKGDQCINSFDLPRSENYGL